LHDVHEGPSHVQDHLAQGYPLGFIGVRPRIVGSQVRWLAKGGVTLPAGNPDGVETNPEAREGDSE